MVDPIPTGFPELDSALGTDGIPRGGVVELWGPNGHDLQKLTFHILSVAQAQGEKVVLIDILPRIYAFNKNELDHIPIYVNHLKNVVPEAEPLIRGGVTLLAISLLSHSQVDAQDKERFDFRAELSKVVGKLNGLITEYHATLMFVNLAQVVVHSTLSGFCADLPDPVAQYSTIRLRILPQLRSDEFDSGDIEVVVQKNIYARPFSKVRLQL